MSHNVELAEKQIVFAEENIDAGRDAVEARGSPKVRRSPRSVLPRGRRTGAPIARRDRQCRWIHRDGGYPTARADRRGDGRDRAGETLDRSSALDTAVETAHIALQYAAANADTDPLGSFTTLVDADTALDEALDNRRAATNLRKRNVELRETGTAAAAAKVSAARDFITRRGAGQCRPARTRLAEAGTTPRLGTEASRGRGQSKPSTRPDARVPSPTKR